MNIRYLFEVISPFVGVMPECVDDLEIDDVTSNLQDATSRSVVFYKIHSGQKAVDLFLKRFRRQDFGILVVNRIPEGLVPSQKQYIVQMNEKFFLRAQKKILDCLFPFDERLKLVGITGTNGKTSVVNLSQQIANLMGRKSISIGTLGICHKNEVLCSDIGATTPSYIELRKIISTYQYQLGLDVIFFEVSSHALIQERLHDLKLDYAAWTNFSQDHLDYHEDMEQYFHAKTLILTKYLKSEGKLIVPSNEEELYQRLIDFTPDTRILKARTLRDRIYHSLPLTYKISFNRDNLEVALELNECSGEKIPEIDLNEINIPKGRFSILEIEKESKLAVIDYAHTPAALENVLKAIKDNFWDYQTSVVFGCGGDRDKSKRAVMGKIASLHADKVFITSDNPRSEDPQEIINDILEGVVSSENCYRIADRKEAILKAIREMREREVLLIAGKGHETYQEIEGVRHPFCDFDIVRGNSNG